MNSLEASGRAALLRRGFTLEYTTLGWNIVGIVVLAYAAITARSVALAGFGLDSLIEIGASTVVIWELSGTGAERQRRALRLIGAAFGMLAVYLVVQSTIVLVIGFHPRHSPAGIVWTTVTALVMFALATGKGRTGRALGNPVLATEDGSPSSTGSSPPPSWRGWPSTPPSAGGGPTPSPDTSSCSMRFGKSAPSSPTHTDHYRSGAALGYHDRRRGGLRRGACSGACPRYLLVPARRPRQPAAWRPGSR